MPFTAFDAKQVGIAALIGLIPGGRGAKAAYESLSAIVLKWIDTLNQPCEEYPFEDMMVDFGVNFMVHYAVGGLADAVIKHGMPAVKKGLQKMGFDEVTIKKWLKDLDDGNGGKGGGCPINSFSAETVVLTRDGLKPISTLKPEEEVWAWHEETGEYGWYPITDVWVHLDPVIVTLII